MAFFTRDKHRKTKDAMDTAHTALRHLSGLSGVWSGLRRDFDPDSKTRVDREVSVDFELNPEGTHVIVHYDVLDSKGPGQSFDVFGGGEATAELVRTQFSGKTRQTQIFSIVRMDMGKRRSDFHLVLETIGWDEARASEIRMEFQHSEKMLIMRTARRLINEGRGYESLSMMKLRKTR